MADPEQLQAEVEILRQQVEVYRQSELDTLREQLAEAKASSAHYKGEAERNAEVGRQIHREAEAERTRLLVRVQALEQLPNARADVAGDRCHRGGDA